MANPNTQDTQKVFKSALEKFSSFNGGVKNVSSTKQMADIYSNMTKLFDTFTQGALLGQGANSEIVLRTVYRSLSDDFLKIVQDTDAVDKIADLMKQKQQALTPEKAETAPVSDTTKKVVTKTLDPSNCDIMSVVVDFVDELQTAILQVKLNLTREWERQKLLRAKSADGQKADLNALNKSFHIQLDTTVEVLEKVQEEDTEWTDEQVDKIEKLVKTFNQVGGSAGKGIAPSGSVDWLSGDKDINQFLRKTNFNVNHLVDTIHRASEQLDKMAAKAKDMAAQAPQPMPQPAVEKPSKPDVRKSDAKVDKIHEKQTSQLLKDSSKIAGSVEKEKKNKAMKQLMSGKQKDDTKLQKKSQLGMGMQDKLQQPQQGSKLQLGPQLGKKKDDEEKLNKDEILSTMGIIHGNIQKFIKGGKIKKAFSINYGGIQKQVQKQIKKTDKGEQQIKDDLDDTKDGIHKLKKKAKSNWLSKFIFMGGPAGLLFVAVGAILLITLVRKMLRNWKKKYMPETDPGTFTILGIPIPGINTLKAIGLGLWNFLVVGLPEKFNKIKSFFLNVHEELFGKKGCMRNMDMIVLTLKKIVFAWIIGRTKKMVGGWIATLLLKLVKVIPGWGTAIGFIAELAPALYSFITTQLMLLWAKGEEQKIQQKESLEEKQRRVTRTAIKHLKRKLAVAARGIKPFVPPHAFPGLMTPRWTPGDINAHRPPRAAILRKAQKIRFRKEKDYATSKESVQQVKNVYSGDVELFTEGEIEKIYNRWGGTLTGEVRNSRKAQDLEEGIFYNASKAMECYNSSKRTMEGHKKNKEAKKIDVSNYTWAVELGVREYIDPFIESYVDQIEKHIKQLQAQHEKRFGDIGDIYDFETNTWNPRLLIKQSDLLTAMPWNPLLPLHNKQDISMGTVSDKGVPFGWNFRYGDGKYMYMEADPIMFQIERANARIKELRSLQDHLHNNQRSHGVHLRWGWKGYRGTEAGGGCMPGDLIECIRRYWLKNFQYPNGEGLNKKSYDYDGVWDEQAARWHLGIDQHVSTLKQFNEERVNWESPNLAKTKIGKGQYATAITVSSEQKGKHDYDEEMKKHEKEAGGIEGWKNRLQGNINKFWDIKVLNASYGNARRFMLDCGVAHLFDNGAIRGPISWAAHIIKEMYSNSFFASLPTITAYTSEIEKIGDLAFLIRRFITSKYKVGKDWNWDAHLFGDQVMVNTIATSVLEYFGYLVIPQWYSVEKALIGLTNGNVDEKTVNDQITKLLQMLDGQSLLNFLFRHVRFMNNQVTVIDYETEGITEEQIKELDMWRQKRGIPILSEKKGILSGWESMFSKFGSMSGGELKNVLSKLEKQILSAAYEAKYTGNHEYENDLRRYYQAAYGAYKNVAGAGEASKLPSLGIQNKNPMSGKSPAEQREEEKKREEEDKKREAERRKKQEEETAKRLAEEAERKKKLVEAQERINAIEAIKKHEQAYENMLERLVKTPGDVKAAELNEFRDDVKNLKQEAENRINKLPREEREMKLALLRGDTLSDKTFAEMKETAIGLHGSLQGYIDEVGKIPVGSVLAIQNPPNGGQTTVPQIDTDKVDMGD